MIQMSPSQQFVYTRTYSRWIEDLKRRETYPESVERTMAFFQKEIGEVITPHFFKIGKQAMLDQESLCSMRAMWSAGEAARRNNITLYNCSYLTISSIEAFSEVLFVLMCGTGVGFSVERRYIDHLPALSAKSSQQIKVVVEDSREGWSDALDKYIRAMFAGQDVKVDASGVRPRGARLMTMGGRASGPEPLLDLFNFLSNLFEQKRARGQYKLYSIDVLDICNKIAEIVVVGGVRRSSEISLSDLEDTQIARAKQGEFWVANPHRAMSNNSTAYNVKPDLISFMDEFSNLIRSGSGERGIYNREGARKQLTASGRRKDDENVGTNPCVPGYTEILTSEGYIPIEQVVDTKVKIWNGFEWSEVVPKVTGKNQPLVRVDLSSGQSLTCTPSHEFVISTDYVGGKKKVKAGKLEIGMKLIKTSYPLMTAGKTVGESIAYTQGFISAEGMDNYSYFYVFQPKLQCMSRMSLSKIGLTHGSGPSARASVKPSFSKFQKSFVPFEWDIHSKLSWLAGLFDGDGTVCTEGGIQVASVNRPFLINLQKMLTTMGTDSKVVLGNPAGMREMPDGRGGKKFYDCLETQRILIGAMAVKKLKDLGLKCSRLAITTFTPNRSASRFVQVTGVTEAGEADKVYCFTEPKRHLGCFEGVVTGQCGEILLRDQEFCNLSEVIVRANDNRQSLRAKVKVAAMFGAWQASFTKFPYLRNTWKKNCEEERLLGVSLTGIMDNPVLNNVNDRMKRWLGELKSLAIEETERWCERLNINMSAAVTCVKPSGTVSQLTNCSSGIHQRYSDFYIRRYRISATDPLFRMLRDQGVPYSPEVSQDPGLASTFVLDFPIASPKGAKTRHDFTALQQLEHWKTVKEFWTEHNPSITVYVGEEEWLDTAAWCYRNFDDLCGVSFLPRSQHVYQLAPYQEIEELEYKNLVKSFPQIDYSELSKYEQEDNTEGSRTYNCTGDKCEI